MLSKMNAELKSSLQPFLRWVPCFLFRVSFFRFLNFSVCGKVLFFACPRAAMPASAHPKYEQGGKRICCSSTL